MIPDIVAYHWLGPPSLKYRVSRWVAETERPESWDMPLSQVLAKHEIRLDDVSDLRGTIEALRGHVRWKPDLWFQLRDLVSPPILLLDAKGDDCDGSAMLIAQAIEFALKPYGWRSVICSLLARPFTKSHHFAIGVDPEGLLHPVQPFPAEWQPADGDPIWPLTYESYDEAAHEIMGLSYDAQVRALDIRDCRWNVIEAWRRPR